MLESALTGAQRGKVDFDNGSTQFQSVMEALQGLANSLVDKLLDRLWPPRAERKRKRHLQSMLRDGRWPYARTLERLMLETGTTREECTRLLAEVGAVGAELKGGRIGYRLPGQTPK